MEKRTLGKTGIAVSVLGFGGAEIWFEREAAGDAAIETLLNTLLDLGVTLVDTAECYEESEELIGRFIGHRRSEFTLTTKIGHAVIDGGGPEWDIPMLEQTVDRGLKRLRTDAVDVIQLHTCSLEMLEQGDVVDVLVRAKKAGKTRFIGYSGDNEAAHYAVNMGVFDTLQTSFSIVDQSARTSLFDRATAAGMGIICKRPIGNGVLGLDAPRSDYSKDYWERGKAVTWPQTELDPIEMSLRYTLAFPVSTMIVGTKNVEHFKKNIETAAKGALPAGLVDQINTAYDLADQDWKQQS